MRVEVVTISWLWKGWAKEQGEEGSLGQVIRLRRPVKDSVYHLGAAVETSVDGGLTNLQRSWSTFLDETIAKCSLTSSLDVDFHKFIYVEF